MKTKVALCCRETKKQENLLWANDLIYGFKEELETIKQALLKAQALEAEFEEFLDFKDGRTISSVTYEGKQIVAMPLEKYDKLMERNMEELDKDKSE